MENFNPDEALCLTGKEAAEVRAVLAELAGGCPRCTHGLNTECTCTLLCEVSDCTGAPLEGTYEAELYAEAADDYDRYGGP